MSARPTPQVALTIAGFDPGSGAGITADLQVFAAHGFWGTAAITALTVQSTRGVFATDTVKPAILRAMLNRLVEDMAPSAIKIGMLAERDTVLVVADFLAGLSSRAIPTVLDPVMISSSGRELLDEGGAKALVSELLPLVDWITPNGAELEALARLANAVHPSTPPQDDALERLAAACPHLHIVRTGGDDGQPVDWLRTPAGERHRFEGTRIDTTSTHGTGCAFSSALAARLAQGHTPVQAVALAKAYVEAALRAAPGVGGGRGPLGLLDGLLP